MKLGLGLPIASMSAVRHPVYGIDVGHALANMVNDDRVLGNTYEFIGPRQYTTKELVDYMQEITRHKFHIYEAHPLFLKALGYLSEKSPWEPYFTVDEAVRDSLSETPTGLPGLADLGVTPTQLHQVAISFLRRYRDFLYYEEHVTANEYRV
jgi:NADH dehydrogenase (ubiquinone) 1 alpha subcomplex subunit 9